MTSAATRRASLARPGSQVLLMTAFDAPVPVVARPHAMNVVAAPDVASA